MTDELLPVATPTVEDMVSGRYGEPLGLKVRRYVIVTEYVSEDDDPGAYICVATNEGLLPAHATDLLVWAVRYVVGSG